MSHVVLNERGIRHLFSRKGAVGRIIDNKAALIHDNALSNIQSKLQRRTGDLIEGLKKVPLEDATGYHVAVGTHSEHTHGPSGPFPYARALETGIDPLTGAPMNYHFDFAFMVPAVRQSGFRLRKA